MTKVEPRTPSGFVEYLPGEQIEFNRLLDIIRSTYEKYGFGPIDTPDVELSEVLLAKGGGETEQEVYRFTRGRNDLSLRFDLTVPLARYTAQHEAELAFPFRRYHIGRVHRAERAQAGRFREFYQCDIDVIGSESTVIDAEFPAIISEIFEQFSFGDFTIRLNNRKVLSGFFESLGLTDKTAEILRVVDKMEKLERAEIIAELAKLDLSQVQVDAIMHFTSLVGTNDEILAALHNVNITNEKFTEGVTELEMLVTSLRKMGVAEPRFAIDLKIARGLDYYTSTVYETILNDYPQLGSVCSGGRYDDLASHYTNTNLPGVGISIGLTRLFYKLREAGMIMAERQTPAKIVVMPIEQVQYEYALEIAALLRQANIATVLYTEPNQMKKKLRYADRMGFEYVVVIGEEEASSDSVSLKNMKTGKNDRVQKLELVKTISDQ